MNSQVVESQDKIQQNLTTTDIEIAISQNKKFRLVCIQDYFTRDEKEVDHQAEANYPRTGNAEP